jgi:hypothetical protein
VKTFTSPDDLDLFNLSTVFEVCGDGQGNLAISKLLALKKMESTIRTLCGIVLFKLDTIFFHVFYIRTGLLRTDSTYTQVPGDQGGLFFFTLSEFFLALIFVQIELLQFVAYCLTFAK